MALHQTGYRGLAGAVALTLTFLLGCGGEPPPDEWVTTCPAVGGQTMPPDEAPFLGRAGAPVSVVIFGDVTCPYTIRMLLALDTFMARLDEVGRSDEIEVQFRYFLRAGTKPPAISLEAAHEQGNDAFWQMFWCLAMEDVLTDTSILFCAEASGLDLPRFEQSVAADSTSAAVDRDIVMAHDLGYEGIPGVLLCGVPYASSPDAVIDNLEYLLFP